jgi:hypothetical protein
MILFKRKKPPYLLFFAVLILLILLVPLNKRFYQDEIWSVIDKIESYDLGFSSIKSLIKGNASDKVIYSTAFSKTPIIFSNYISGVDERPEIKRVDIEIKFKNYRKILEDRKKSIKNDIGIEFGEVNAKIKFEGKNIKSKIRLKGDLKSHWRSLQRMSFRVSLKGDNSLFGFKKFSIHKPSARQHPYDQAFQNIQNQLNNLAPEHSYIHLFVNGEDWGIMNVEEHMSKELLEKQKSKESLILKFGDEKYWRYKKNSKNLYDDYRLSDPILNIKAFGFNKYKEQNIYRKWYSYVAKEHIKQSHFLYDNDSFTKSLLLALSWNLTHTLFPSNSRYYFNPYTLKLYPITTDQGQFSLINDKIQLPKIYSNLIKNSFFETNFKNNNDQVKSVLSKSQEIIDKWQSFFPLDKKIQSEILTKNNYKISNNFKDYLLLDKLSVNENESLTKKQSKDLQDHIHARHFENGEIHIYNLLKDEVYIDSISLDGVKIINSEKLLIKGYDDSYSPFKLMTELKGLYDEKIEIYTSNNGFSRIYNAGYSHLVYDMHNPFLNITNIDEINYIERKNNSTYQFKKGNWKITKPLIIDGNLIIQKGTILSFDTDSYMIIKGNVEMKGTRDEKIILKAINNSWKGMYIFEAKKRSILNHVVIQETNFFKDGLLNLTGAVNFYKSDVDIKNTEFINSIAEDALNIVHSDFLLDQVTIDTSVSDGFDSDFSTGIITNSVFKNINGDGVDFSGSNVKINESFFSNIKDKAVSSGEASNLYLKNLTIDNVGVGVASKDGSITEANGLNISNYNLNALMTYIKKSFYTEPSLSVFNIKLDSKENPYSRQKGTEMKVDGKNVVETILDVDTMYKSGVMKK